MSNGNPNGDGGGGGVDGSGEQSLTVNGAPA